MAMGVLGLAATCCAPPPDDAVLPFRGDTAVAPALPDCIREMDRPPGNNHPWVFDGPADADVVWGIRPSASWNGTAAVLNVGPGGGCNPCTLSSKDFGSLFRSASELAVEVELSCDAEVLSAERTFALTGIRLKLHGTDDGVHVSLLDLPIQLTTLNADGDGCTADNSDGADTRALRNSADALEPGRTLDYRIPLGPLVASAGHNPQAMTIGLYDVQLEVYALAGSTGWIELGRTLVDGCL